MVAVITVRSARRTGATLVRFLLVSTMLVSMRHLSTTTVRAFSSSVPSLRRLQQHLHQQSVLASRRFVAASNTALFSTLSGTELDELNAKIKSKGDEIRDLKEAGTAKPDLAPHIQELLALKAQLPVADVDESASSSLPKTKEKKKAKVTQKKPPAVKKAVEEMSENELRLNRLAKVEAMKEAGVEPFEYTYGTTHTAVELSKMYEGKLEPGEEDEEADVTVAGRVMTRRVFGKLAFFTLQDETGVIQLQFDKSRLAESFKVSGCHHCSV